MKVLFPTQTFLQVLVCLLITQIGFAQFTIPEKPEFQTSVYDYAKILSETEKSQLEEKLVSYSDSTSTQIVIVTIESLKGEDVSQLATNWAENWGIGQTKEDNGVIILLSKAERKIAINPGYGLEDRLTAGTGGEIIRNIITPEFKSGNYYRGLDKGTTAIIDVFKGKYKATRKQKKGEDFPLLIFIIIVVIVIILIVRTKINDGNSGGKGTGGFGSGPSLLDILVLSSLGRSSGGFGGSSGGSFGGGGFGGGFGGGGFSGGGSSGSW